MVFKGGLNGIADEAQIKTEPEEIRKPEARANPFLGNIAVVKE